MLDEYGLAHYYDSDQNGIKLQEGNVVTAYQIDKDGVLYDTDNNIKYVRDLDVNGVGTLRQIGVIDGRIDLSLGDAYVVSYGEAILGIDYGNTYKPEIEGFGITGGDPLAGIRRQVAVPEEFAWLADTYIDPGSMQVNPARWNDFLAESLGSGLRMIVTSNGLSNAYLQGWDNARIIASGAGNAIAVNVYNPTRGNFMKDLPEAFMGQVGQQQTVIAAGEIQIREALKYNNDLSELIKKPVFTDVIGHSQGSINLNRAIMALDTEGRLKINLFNVGTATPWVPSGLNKFVSIMDVMDSAGIVAGGQLQRFNPVYWGRNLSDIAQGRAPSYQTVNTFFLGDGQGDTGNFHSFYLYAQRQKVQDSFGWANIPQNLTQPWAN